MTRPTRARLRQTLGTELRLGRLCRRAHALLSLRSAWTKGADARAVGAIPVHPCSDDAVCWCLAGALHYLSEGDDALYELAVRRLSERVGRPLQDWNDAPEREHEDILILLERLMVGAA